MSTTPLTKAQIQQYVAAGFSLAEIADMSAAAQPAAPSADGAAAITAAAVQGAAPAHTHGVDDFVDLVISDISVKTAEMGPCVTLYCSVANTPDHPVVRGVLSFSDTVIDPEASGKSRWQGQTMSAKSADIAKHIGLVLTEGADALKASAIGVHVRGTLRYELNEDTGKSSWSVAAFATGGGIDEDALDALASFSA